MCGRGRNKPSRGKPHFLIASFLPFSSRGSSPARNGGERDGNGKWARFIVSLFIRSRERAAAPERIASDVGYTYDPIASAPFREFSSFSSDRAARVIPRYCRSFLSRCGSMNVTLYSLKSCAARIQSKNER